MKLNRSSFLLKLLILLCINGCSGIPETQTSTSLLPDPATVTSHPAPAEFFISTPTAYLWLPYNNEASDEGCIEFIATLPIDENTTGLSEKEIATRLFEIYLQHFTSAELGGICKLENFTIEFAQMDQNTVGASERNQVDFVRNVRFSVQVKESPSNWVAGNGELSANGWILRKSLYIGVIRFSDQYVLKIIGTAP